MEKWWLMWTLFRRFLVYPHLFLIAWEDGKTGKIPGTLLKSLLCRGCVLLFLKCIFYADPGVLLEAFEGFLTGGGAVFLIRILTRGGIGAGDVKFLAAAGFCFGSKTILRAQIFAVFLACPVCVYLFLTGNHRKRKGIPLATFLSAGILLADCLQR